MAELDQELLAQFERVFDRSLELQNHLVDR